MFRLAGPDLRIAHRQPRHRAALSRLERDRRGRAGGRSPLSPAAKSRHTNSDRLIYDLGGTGVQHRSRRCFTKYQECSQKYVEYCDIDGLSSQNLYGFLRKFEGKLCVKLRHLVLAITAQRTLAPYGGPGFRA